MKVFKMLILVLLLLFMSSFVSASLVKDLESHIGFEGDVVDSFGVHSGSVHGATYVPTIGVNGSGSLFFDGLNDYVNVTNIVDNTDSPYSLSFWFNASSAGLLYSAGYKSSTPRGEALMIGLNNLTDAYVQLYSSYTWYSITDLPINSGWNNLVVVRNTSSSFQIYINGVLEGDLSFTPIASNSNYNDYIGARNNNNVADGFGFTGYVDELVFYNRVLSAADVAELQYSFFPFYASEPVIEHSFVSPYPLVSNAALSAWCNASDLDGNYLSYDYKIYDGDSLFSEYAGGNTSIVFWHNYTISDLDYAGDVFLKDNHFFVSADSDDNFVYELDLDGSLVNSYDVDFGVFFDIYGLYWDESQSLWFIAGDSVSGDGVHTANATFGNVSYIFPFSNCGSWGASTAADLTIVNDTIYASEYGDNQVHAYSKTGSCLNSYTLNSEVFAYGLDYYDGYFFVGDAYKYIYKYDSAFASQLARFEVSSTGSMNNFSYMSGLGVSNNLLYFRDWNEDHIYIFNYTGLANNNPPDVAVNVVNVSSSFLSVGDSWVVSCRAFDGSYYSDWLNSSSYEIINKLNLSFFDFDSGVLLSQQVNISLVGSSVTYISNVSNGSFYFEGLNSDVYRSTFSSSGYDSTVLWLVVDNGSLLSANVYLSGGLVSKDFIVRDSFSAPLGGVLLSFYKVVNGSSLLVTQSLTGFDGRSSVSLVDGDYYSVVASVAGYDSLNGSFIASESEYEIVLYESGLLPSSSLWDSIISKTGFSHGANSSHAVANLTVSSASSGFINNFGLYARYGGSLFISNLSSPYGGVAFLNVSPLNLSADDLLVVSYFFDTDFNGFSAWNETYYLSSVVPSNITASGGLFDDLFNLPNSSPLKGLIGMSFVLLFVLIFGSASRNMSVGVLAGLLALGFVYKYGLVPKPLALVSIVVIVVLLISDNIGGGR